MRNHYDLEEIENYYNYNRTKTIPKRLAGKAEKANFRQTANRFSIKNGQLYCKESRTVIADKDRQVDIIHDINSFWENANIRKSCCTFLLMWDLQRCCGLHTKFDRCQR